MTGPQQQQHQPAPSTQPQAWVRWLVGAVGAALGLSITVLLLAAGRTVSGPAAGTSSAYMQAILPAATMAGVVGALCWIGLMTAGDPRRRAQTSVPAAAYALLVVPVTLIGGVAGAATNAIWGRFASMDGASGMGVPTTMLGEEAGLSQIGLVSGAMAALIAHLIMLSVVSHQILKTLRKSPPGTNLGTADRGETS